jgi:hypothetical protein
MLPKAQSLVEYLLRLGAEGKLRPLPAAVERIMLEMAEAAKWEMAQAGHWHDPVAQPEGA